MDSNEGAFEENAGEMIFDNFQIHSKEIPAIEEVYFEPLERDYLWMRITGFSLFMLLILGFLLIISVKKEVVFWQMFLPWFGVFALVMILQIRGFKIKSYAIRQNDISYKSGLIFFGMTSVPFNRIQHVEVSQGPLARLFELATVKVYTAGGSTSDLSIGGLKKAEAHRLRDHISHLSSKYE